MAGAGAVELRLGVLRLQRRDSASERSAPLSRVNFGIGPHYELISELEYLVAAALIGVALGRLLGLAPQGSRALVFSLGTRNSFVILPLTLALPAQWQAATLVVVLQSLVELFGMIVYVWVVPRFLIPSSQVNPEAT
jgi:hypothetical protein